MKDKLNYSVVIVTYNRLKLLKECLGCCFRQSVPFKEILVVDNDSSDGTDKYLDDLSDTRDSLHVYHAKENLGGAGGFNKALELVGKDTDYILIIDDDAFIDRDYIKNIEPYITDDILAYSGTVYETADRIPAQRHMLKSETFLFCRPVDVKQYDLPHFNYDLTSFCGLLISSKLVIDIGFPLKEYFIQYDDIEYSLRIRRKTGIMNVNSAFLTHETQTGNPPDSISWKSYYAYRNSWDMCLKYSKHPFIYSSCRFLFHILKIIMHLFMGLNPKHRKYNLDVAALNLEVLKYPFSKQLGLNPKYAPGTKIG